MKRTLLIVAAVAVLASCSSREDGYVIKGKITGSHPALADGKAILSNNDRNDPISDTVDIVNGKFSFTGKVDSPEFYRITIPGMDGRFIVFLENDTYSVACTDSTFMQNAEIGLYLEGGKTNGIYRDINAATRAMARQTGFDVLMKEYQDPATSAERKQQILPQLRQANDLMAQWSDSIDAKVLGENPHSIYALEQIPSKIYDLEADSIKTLIAEYVEDPAFAGNKTLARIQEQVKVLESTAVGAAAPDFTLATPDGKTLAFSDVYKDAKITMIDFWASWCGPCRRANPTIVKAYKAYKGKGFQIIGVSLDNDHGKWVEAIGADGLTWPQVSDLKGWDSAAAALYGIRYIPQNVFVDASGKIVGKRVDPDEIEKFVSDNLK